MSVRDLPALNAALNGVSAVLLLIGFILIKQGRRDAHERAMLAALASSALFLTSYVVYHWQVGSVRFGGTGLVRTVYFAILISHVVLAVVIVPLVIATVLRAFQRRFDLHRRIAWVTLPLWAYVSVTGVVIYWMLYHLPPQGLIK
jgi:putative membrane protein